MLDWGQPFKDVHSPKLTNRGILNLLSIKTDSSKFLLFLKRVSYFSILVQSSKVASWPNAGFSAMDALPWPIGRAPPEMGLEVPASTKCCKTGPKRRNNVRIDRKMCEKNLLKINIFLKPIRKWALRPNSAWNSCLQCASTCKEASSDMVWTKLCV